MQFIAMMFPLTTREIYAPCSFTIISDILEFTAMRPIPIYLSKQNHF